MLAKRKKEYDTHANFIFKADKLIQQKFVEDIELLYVHGSLHDKGHHIKNDELKIIIENHTRKKANSKFHKPDLVITLWLEIKEKKVLKLKEWTINDNNDLIAVRTEERTIQQTRVSRKAKKMFPGFLGLAATSCLKNTWRNYQEKTGKHYDKKIGTSSAAVTGSNNAQVEEV